MRCYVPLFLTATLAAVPAFGGDYSLNLAGNATLAPMTYQREARPVRRTVDFSPPVSVWRDPPELHLERPTQLEKNLENIWIWTRPDRDLSVLNHPAFEAQYGFELAPRPYSPEATRAIEELADEVTEEVLEGAEDIPLVGIVKDFYHRFVKRPVESKGVHGTKRNFDYDLHPAVHLSTGSHVLGIKGEFKWRTGILPPIKSELEIFYEEYELRFKLYSWNRSDLTFRVGVDQRGEGNRGVMLTVRTSSDEQFKRFKKFLGHFSRRDTRAARPYR